MTQDQLGHIEIELKISLPREYRESMLAYPLTPDADDELPNDPVFVIEKNRYYQQHGFFGLTWSQHYFAFGGDGTGNQYFFDLSLDSSPVFFADHETKEFVIESTSFIEWLEKQKKVQAEINAEQAEEEKSWSEYREKNNAKTWWQFWR